MEQIIKSIIEIIGINGLFFVIAFLSSSFMAICVTIFSRNLPDVDKNAWSQNAIAKMDYETLKDVYTK